MGLARIVLCLAIICPAAGVARGDAPAVKADDAADVNFYLNGMLAERQKLRSGEFVVSGTTYGKDPTITNVVLSGKMFIACSFDDERIRMDNLEPIIGVDLPVTKPPTLRQIQIERKFFHTPKANVAWFPLEGRRTVENANGVPPNGRFFFFDVRMLGLVAAERMRGGHPSSSSVGKAVQSLRGSACGKSVDLSEPDCPQLVFRMEGGRLTSEQRYWIRPDQGFAPVRFESRTRPIACPDESWNVSSRTTVDWKEIDGVWVPVALDSERIKPPGEARLAWKIRWRSVNKPLDDRLFTWEDFGAPEGLSQAR